MGSESGNSMGWERCAILIPTRNRPGILDQTLTELRRQGLGALPLWVYDDASDDPGATSKVVSSWPGGQVIRNEVRQGQAAGRNMLMRHCGKEYGIFLDDDNYFLELGALAVHVNGNAPANRAVVAFQNRAKSTGRLDYPPTRGACASPFFLGGCSLFNIPLVLSAGGYRDFWVYRHEEIDLAMRLFARGLEIWYDPSILVEHNQWYAPDEQRDYREYDFLDARNAFLLRSMNMPLPAGLCWGLLHSTRGVMRAKRNRGARVRGLMAGLVCSFSKWRQRTPMSLRQYLAWSRQRLGTPVGGGELRKAGQDERR